MFWRGGCFGSATVGAKGQLVIPAQARKNKGIKPGDKLLVFGGPEQGVLILLGADRVSELVARSLDELTALSSTLGLSGAGERRTAASPAADGGRRATARRPRAEDKRR
jgi:AbrB family looped-hinge helix DNA binding protein